MLLKLSAISMIPYKKPFQTSNRAPHEDEAEVRGRRGRSDLCAGGVGGAAGSLAPAPALTTQLLRPVLPHPLQQQVVDRREVVVAAALQGLRETEDP